jgi:hypothetical protein
MFRPSPRIRASFASQRSKIGAQEATAHEQGRETPTGEPDVALQMLFKSVRDSEHIPGMENVRACCDGEYSPIHTSLIP